MSGAGHSLPRVVRDKLRFIQVMEDFPHHNTSRVQICWNYYYYYYYLFHTVELLLLRNLEHGTILNTTVSCLLCEVTRDIISQELL